MSVENSLSGRALYVCYFGLREPLVQTQVLPYIRQLRDAGMEMSILTFEADPSNKWSQEELERARIELSDEGIRWHSLTYHKSPSVPATVFDILCGSYFVWKFIRNENPGIIHARVHTPALMGAIGNKLSGNKSKLLFDIRGFFPEEYTDAGRWKKNGLLYKTVKRIEKWLLDESDGFVVLTEKAREILFPESKETGVEELGRPVEVIPCCVDLEKFDSKNEFSRGNLRRKLGIEDRFVIAYVGSFGGWYLTKETADFLGAAKSMREDLFAMILTQSDPEEIHPLLKDHGFEKGDYLITKVAPDAIPEYLSAADIGLSFIKPCYSKQSSSPTKNAEYLASGLPMVANSGVGDTAEMTLEDDVGVIIGVFSQQAYKESFGKVLKLLQNTPEIKERCRQSARARFDLKNVGGLKYQRIYKSLLRLNKDVV